MTKRQLQLAVEAARAGQRRGRFSAELKRALGAYCAEQRARGAGWAGLVADLALSENQLREWSGGSGRRAPKLRRMKVIAGSGSAPVTSGAGLCVELPGGGRVTGLHVADVAALLRELR